MYDTIFYSKNPMDIVDFIKLTEKHNISHKKIFKKYAIYSQYINNLFYHCYYFVKDNPYYKYNNDLKYARVYACTEHNDFDFEKELVNKFIFQYIFKKYIKQIKIIFPEYWKSDLTYNNVNENILLHRFCNLRLIDKQENLLHYIDCNRLC